MITIHNPKIPAGWYQLDRKTKVQKGDKFYVTTLDRRWRWTLSSNYPGRQSDFVYIRRKPKKVKRPAKAKDKNLLLETTIYNSAAANGMVFCSGVLEQLGLPPVREYTLIVRRKPFKGGRPIQVWADADCYADNKIWRWHIRGVRGVNVFLGSDIDRFLTRKLGWVRSKKIKLYFKFTPITK